MTLLETLNRLPPCACRLLARKRVGAKWVGLSHREIQQRSRLPKSTVAELSFRKTWDGVPVDVLVQFAEACGVNHLRSYEQVRHLYERQMTHTMTGQRQQIEMYNRLYELLAEIRAEQTQC